MHKGGLCTLRIQKRSCVSTRSVQQKDLPKATCSLFFPLKECKISKVTFRFSFYSSHKCELKKLHFVFLQGMILHFGVLFFIFFQISFGRGLTVAIWDISSLQQLRSLAASGGWRKIAQRAMPTKVKCILAGKLLEGEGYQERSRRVTPTRESISPNIIRARFPLH